MGLQIDRSEGTRGAEGREAVGPTAPLDLHAEQTGSLVWGGEVTAVG